MGGPGDEAKRLSRSVHGVLLRIASIASLPQILFIQPHPPTGAKPIPVDPPPLGPKKPHRIWPAFLRASGGV